VSQPPEIRDRLWSAVARGYSGWDVGAGRGTALPDFVTRFSEILAFEPNPTHHDQLKAWADITKLFDFALSDHDGTVTLPALGSVACRSVDNLVHVHGFQRPDFLNINVGGHELRVLNGARNLIQIYRPQFLIEFYTPENREDAAYLLGHYGYQLDTIRHPHYTPGSDMWRHHGWLTATYPS
jgi:hypothetical protein